MKLDLNAKRAERAKARGEGMFVVIGKDQIELLPELPLDLEVLTSENTLDVLKLLLKKQSDFAKLKAAHLSFQDVLEIVQMYGVALGESVSAVESSIVTSAQSNRTGKGSTTAISRRTSTANRRLASVDSSA